MEAAVTSVKTKGLARFVHPSHGRSALRYGHTLDEALGLDTRPLALLAVLMLRGPQTLGELRTRTERMVRFSDLREVQAELDALAARTEPLVRATGPRPGAERGPLRPAPGRSRSVRPGRDRAAIPEHPGHLPLGPPPTPGPRRPVTSRARRSDEVGALRAEVAELRAEVAALRRALDDLRRAARRLSRAGPAVAADARPSVRLRHDGPPEASRKRLAPHDRGRLAPT